MGPIWSFTVARKAAWLTILAGICGISQAQPQTDLTNSPIEDLLNLKITSVSKTEQKLQRSPAAVFVITQEDIRRSGAANIPDLLRMVPGFDVAQINSNTWAISARGSNGRFSHELLVMVDGRTVYAPTFGGVFWDILDVPLENIQRIEVIRGPGGSIWGANAVNGVINIITKKASATQGTLVEGRGSSQGASGILQYGGNAGAATNYRAYANYLDEEERPALNGRPGGDGWHLLRGGFRMDTTLSSRDRLTIQGDLYRGESGGISATPSYPEPQHLPVVQDLSGGFLQMAWDHTFSSRSDTSLQISYDAYARDDVLMEKRKTIDLDFQHHFEWGERNDIVWGLGYRGSTSQSNGDAVVFLSPANVRTQLFSSFVQDEIALIPDKLSLTLGTKVEHVYYTGLAVMPSARFAWMLDPHQTIWTSLSRALRTPAETDAAVHSDIAGSISSDGIPAIIRLSGNPSLKNEVLLAYEMGYRTTIGDRFSLDVALYYNAYSDQQTIEPLTPFLEGLPLQPLLVLPFTYQNLMSGESHGIEVYANWKVTNRWSLGPGFAVARIRMHLDPQSRDTLSVASAEGSSPANSAQLRSHYDVSRGLSWNTSAFVVGRLTAPAVPGYTRLDSNLTWQYKKGISFVLGGQNLLQGRHLEFVDPTTSAQSTLVSRTAFLKVTWVFE